MMSTIAFEIGAAFLLAVLLMHLSSRGMLPEILKHVRFVAIAAVLFIAGIALYRWLPNFDFWPSAAPAPAVVAPVAIPAKGGPIRPIAPSPRATIREVETPVEIAPPPPAKPQAAEPPAALEEAPVPEKGNRVKRWMRSVGRALHPSREKDPPQ
jgi:hypothetical protein